VHICYGYGIEENIRWKETLGDEWRQYEQIFPALNASKIDQISLECASSHVPHSVMGILKDKILMVGAVAVTQDHVETPQEVAATIRSHGFRRPGAYTPLHQLRHDADRLQRRASQAAQPGGGGGAGAGGVVDRIDRCRSQAINWGQSRLILIDSDPN